MNLYPKGILPIYEVKKFTIIFYSVGALGFLIPWLRNFFITITPFALLLAFYLLAIYHENYSKREVIVFGSIAIAGFIIEAAGVNTGAIFGTYWYGAGLFIKIYNTPLLIGLNWLFLTYTSIVIAQKITKKPFLQVLLAPTLMVGYDLVLEQLAPMMDMWRWSGSVIPIRNYVAWWLIGFLFVGIVKVQKIEPKNPIAAILFVCQLVFFLVVYILSMLLQ